MENGTKDAVTVDDLMSEFDFVVPGVATDEIIVPPVEGTPEEIEAAAEKERLAAEGKTPEEIEADKEAAEVEAARIEAEKGKTPEELAADKEAAAQALKNAAEEVIPAEAGSFYKNLALKYIESGKWGSDLAVELDGEEVPIKDLEAIDEETFFEIEKAIEEADAEDFKTKFVSISELDDRKKNLVTIIREGGDLSEIFKSSDKVEEYLNPFEKFDLDDERIQERVYLNALVTYNKLDQEQAQAVVNKAKKDLTLDTKVKSFVDDYTKTLDAFVESKKDSIIQEKATRKKELAEFKKSLSEQYKGYGLKDSLVRKLTDSVVKETEQGYQIDSIYDQKMKDPAEAAELVLFLNDKEAYLEAKLKGVKIQEKKKTMRLIKVMPKQKAKANAADAGTAEDDEFNFTVKKD